MIDDGFLDGFPDELVDDGADENTETVTGPIATTTRCYPDRRRRPLVN